MTTSEAGLVKLLMEVSLLIAMLCTLGSVPASLKFYPFYKSYLPPKKNDLPFWTILFCIIGCLLFLLITPLFENLIVRKYSERSPLFVQYFYLIYPLTITFVFNYLFEAYSWSLQKTILPNFLREIGFRILTTILLSFYIFKWINFKEFVVIYSFMFILPVLILLYSLIKSKQYYFNITLSSVSRRMGKRIIVFSLFIFSGQFLNVLSRTADTIIISSQSANGLGDAFVFTIATYLVTLMDVPLRGMTGITASVIAQAWKDRNIQRLDSVYRKTTISLMVAGLGIWALLLLNMHNAVKYFGSTYAILPEIIIIIGLAKIIDLGTGMNAQILLSSKYWKVDFFTNMAFVILAIPLNVFFVKKFNLIGAAYANLIAIFIFNFTRFLFIWKFFKLQPYTINNLKAIVAAVACFFLVYFLPGFDNLFVDTAIRSIIFIAIYLTAILVLNVSEDITGLLISVKRRLFAYFSKSSKE